MSTQLSCSMKRKIFDITNGRCFYCGCNLDFYNFQIDHHIPKAIGGKESGNRVPSCQDCNLIKSDHTIEEFRKIIEGYYEKDIRVRLINKYMGINRKKVKFYFEENNFEPK